MATPSVVVGKPASSQEHQTSRRPPVARRAQHGGSGITSGALHRIPADIFAGAHATTGVDILRHSVPDPLREGGEFAGIAIRQN